MKVKQEGIGFAPITITIETKEEADFMWAALNVPPDKIAHYTDGHLSTIKINHLSYEMWRAYNNVHPTSW